LQGSQLFLPSTHALQRAATARLASILRPLFSLLTWDLYSIAAAEAQPYLRRMRQVLFGRKLEEVAPTGEKHVQALKALKVARQSKES
jgi:hypothetical protein